jgi:hypothetical protein
VVCLNGQLGLLQHGHLQQWVLRNDLLGLLQHGHQVNHQGHLLEECLV